MPRYFVGRNPARAWYEYMPDTYDQRGASPNLTVQAIEAVDTGLVTEDGRPIMRGADEIGFRLSSRKVL